jgi:glycosyltransferase involved in cell wall biosynthesis
LNLDTTLISIIIPTHNSEKTILSCLNSLKNQSYPRGKYEIIVVDDGSTDNTVNNAKEAGVDRVVTIEPCFQGKARNIGVNVAKGEILAFIDSDCAAKENWLETMEKEVKNYKAIGGPVVNGNDHSLVAWAEYLMEFCGWDEFRKRSIVPFVPGCNQVCSKDAFLRAGGFSETRLSEDVLFGYSLQKAGIKLLFVPELQVRHFCRTKLNKYLANMRLLGKYSTRTSKQVPTIYRRITTTRMYIPLVFIVKLGARTKHAIKAKKLMKFLLTLPLIIFGTGSYCKGVWNELSNQKSERSEK